MAKFVKDDHFKFFVDSLQEMLTTFGVEKDEYTLRQKQQVEALIKAEREFRKVLQKDRRGELVYQLFINMITNNNILASRPYFRERQEEFSTGISPAIKSGKPKRLYKFDINYPFISFVLNVFNNSLDYLKWSPNCKVIKAAKKVCEIRNDIIVQNMPLAISRARIFRQKTPEAHLSYMDMVQIASEGLVNAVDKFVLPYSSVFRSVIIGRAVGDLIANYNETLIHFYPSDKRKIYRANKINGSKSEVNYNDLAKAVNKGPKLDNPTNASEIQHLMAASSHVSFNVPVVNEGSSNQEGDTLIDMYAADEDLRPDVKIEKSDLYKKMYSSIDNLQVIEVKLLKMKGIDL